MNKGVDSYWMVHSFIICTIIVFLSDWIQRIGIINFPLGFRHFMILFTFSANFVVYGQKLTLTSSYKNVLIWLSLFLIIAYLFTPATLYNYLLGIFFTFLFVVLFVLGANIKTRNKAILTIFNSLLIFLLLMSIFPILQVIVNGTSLRYNFGYFRELGAFGGAMNIGTIIGISLFLITLKKKYLYIAVFFSFGVIMTILKKTIISNIIVWLAFYIFHANSRFRLKILFYSVIIIVLLNFALGKEFIANFNENANYLENVGAEGHVRLGMYLASNNIAKDYFPFGSGMGTFGSLASIIGGYSKIYFEYGVSEIGANSPQDLEAGHHTLLDTYWPHIWGELGIIGTLLFLYLWLYPVRMSLSLMRSTKNPFIKGLSFYIALIVITMTWEGFSLYTPEIPSFIILHSGLSGLCYFHISRYRMQTNIIKKNIKATYTKINYIGQEKIFVKKKY